MYIFWPFSTKLKSNSNVWSIKLKKVTKIVFRICNNSIPAVPIATWRLQEMSKGFRTHPRAVMIHFEHAFSADGTVVTPVGLDLGAVGTVADLTLDGPHHHRDVFGYDQLLQGGLGVSGGLDRVELLCGQLEAARYFARWSHHNLVVWPRADYWQTYLKLFIHKIKSKEASNFEADEVNKHENSFKMVAIKEILKKLIPPERASITLFPNLLPKLWSFK